MWHLGPQADVGLWFAVESPTSNTLQSVVSTVDGPYAVGGNGTLIRRQSDGNWVVVFDDGPTARDNKLLDAAVTDDGNRVWFAGSSGALGYYDVTTGKKHDYSAPRGKTSTWEAIAVGGNAGSEKVMAANGSGEVLVGFVSGCCPQWGPVKKPGGSDAAGGGGSGASLADLSVGPNGDGYAINTSGSVFKTYEDAWEKIGIENAQNAFTTIYTDQDEILVGGGGGRIYEYEASCNNWTPLGVASNAINDIDRNGNNLVAVGDGGTIFRRENGDEWNKRWTLTTTDLLSVSVSDGPDVAVGNGGMIIERDNDVMDKLPATQQPNGSTGGSSGDSTSDDSTSDDTTSGDSTTS